MAGSRWRVHRFLCRRRLGHACYELINIKKKKPAIRNRFSLPCRIFCSVMQLCYFFYLIKKPSVLRYCRIDCRRPACSAHCSKMGGKDTRKENVYYHRYSCYHYQQPYFVAGDCAVSSLIKKNFPLAEQLMYILQMLLPTSNTFMLFCHECIIQKFKINFSFHSTQ